MSLTLVSSSYEDIGGVIQQVQFEQWTYITPLNLKFADY